MEVQKMLQIISRILILLSLGATGPAMAFFGGDKISSETREILKNNFPYQNVVGHLFEGNPNDIQSSFPNLTLRYATGGETSGAKQEAYMSIRPSIVITQMFSGRNILFVGAAKTQKGIPVQKLIKASHDSRTYKARGQNIEMYFLGYGKEGGKKVKHIMELEFNQALNMKVVNWKLVIDN